MYFAYDNCYVKNNQLVINSWHSSVITAKNTENAISLLDNKFKSDADAMIIVVHGRGSMSVENAIEDYIENSDFSLEDFAEIIKDLKYELKNDDSLDYVSQKFSPLHRGATTFLIVVHRKQLTESKKSARKSIKEASESVIIDGKKTNFKINDYGTFFSEKIKYMLIGEPLENENVLTDFLEENSNFEFEEYKIPYSTVYYIYNDEKSLFGVAYRHYIRLTNDEKDAKIMLAYATNKRDLYNGL